MNSSDFIWFYIRKSVKNREIFNIQKTGHLKKSGKFYKSGKNVETTKKKLYIKKSDIWKYRGWPKMPEKH